MDYKHWIAQTPMGQDSLGKGIEGVVDWAQSYLQSLETRDVSPAVEWGEVLAGLELNPPEQGLAADEIGGLIQQADNEFVDRLVHWNSPRFFAFFPCSNSVPAILGDLMSAVLNVNGMLWSTSPACTELEVRVMDWCAELFGLDDAFAFSRSTTGGGCIQGTASEAVLAALVAARRQCTKRGIDRSKVTVYTSDQAHSSVVKAAMVAGLADDADDRSRVRVLETDADLRIDPAVLERVMLEDIDAGLVPAMVVATIGSTSTGAVDPVSAIADVLDRVKMDGHRCWLHLDAAWAGAASVCPEFRGMMDGHERADSICINPHKWLLTNFDCDLFWVRDHRVLTDSMSIQPAYLKNRASETSEVVDYRDWHVPLGRKMRALKLWMVIRCFGAEGLRSHIRGHVELAEIVERWVVDDPRVELACDRMLGLVCFKVLGDADLTKRLVDDVNARGRVMITHSMVPIADDGAGGRQMCSIARVSVGSPGVGKGDIEVLCTEIKGWLDREVGTR